MVRWATCEMLASASPRNPYVAMLVKSVKSLHDEGTVCDTFSPGGVVADPNPHSSDLLDFDLPFLGSDFWINCWARIRSKWWYQNTNALKDSHSMTNTIFTSLNPNPVLFETSKFSPYTMTQILGKSLQILFLCLSQQNFRTVLKMFQNSCKIKSTYSMSVF